MARLNLGCGRQLPDDYINFDIENWPGRVHQGNVLDGLPWDDEHFEQVYCAHFLYQFIPQDVERILRDVRRVLEPGGFLYLAEFHPIKAFTMWWNGDPLLERLVSDQTEPTWDGKLCRLLTWHGTRKSLWTEDSLLDRLRKQKFVDAERRPGTHGLDQRHEESFYLFARRAD